MGVCRCGKGGISVERLTERKVGQSYPLKDKAASKVGLFTDYDGFYTYFEAVNRLGAIEDILGDEYDLDRLRELVEADREGRCVVLPPDDYTWTIRGDIIRGIIHANCRAAKKEAEAALRREQE